MEKERGEGQGKGSEGPNLKKADSQPMLIASMPNFTASLPKSLILPCNTYSEVRMRSYKGSYWVPDDDDDDKIDVGAVTRCDCEVPLVGCSWQVW